MINLLPPQQKKELIQEENYKLTLILGFLVLVSLICLALILFSITFYLEGEIKLQKIQTELKKEEFSQFQPLQDKLSFFNRNLSKLDTFYKSQINLTPLLERFSEILPPGVYLTSFSYQKETFQISISGFAPTRADLFELRKNLKEKKEFGKVYFPLTVWTVPEGINFTGTLTWLLHKK